MDYYRHPPPWPELSSRRRQRAAPARDLLLHVSEEARRRQRADQRLFGHPSGGTRRSGGDASDRGHLACDLRRVLTLHYCAHVGSGGAAVDLPPPPHPPPLRPPAAW